jgi:hypothetical protein
MSNWMTLAFFHAIRQVVRINGAVEITAYPKATELVIADDSRTAMFVTVTINQHSPLQQSTFYVTHKL